MASQLLKAGDAAQPKGCSACFVPMTAKSVSEVKPSHKRSAHHFEISVREKG